MPNQVQPLGGPSLAEDRSLAQWLRDKFRGNVLQPTIERTDQAAQLEAIRNAGVDINRSLIPKQLPRPQAPTGYTVEDMMRSMVSEEARRKARGQY